MSAITKLLVSVSVHSAPHGRYIARINDQTIVRPTWDALRPVIAAHLDQAHLLQSSTGFVRAAAERLRDSQKAAERRETQKQRMAQKRAPWAMTSHTCGCLKGFCPLSI